MAEASTALNIKAKLNIVDSRFRKNAINVGKEGKARNKDGKVTVKRESFFFSVTNVKASQDLGYYFGRKIWQRCKINDLGSAIKDDGQRWHRNHVHENGEIYALEPRGNIKSN